MLPLPRINKQQLQKKILYEPKIYFKEDQECSADSLLKISFHKKREIAYSSCMLGK